MSCSTGRVTPSSCRGSRDRVHPGRTRSLTGLPPCSREHYPGFINARPVRKRDPWHQPTARHFRAHREGGPLRVHQNARHSSTTCSALRNDRRGRENRRAQQGHPCEPPEPRPRASLLPRARQGALRRCRPARLRGCWSCRAERGVSLAVLRKPEPRRPDPVETMRMACACDRWSREGSAAGLCPTCSGQHGVGRSLGFRRAHAPCRACAYIIASWPGRSYPSGWKHAPRAPRAASGTRTAFPGVTTPADAQRVTEAAA
jgi:hypothetical protein